MTENLAACRQRHSPAGAPLLVPIIVSLYIPVNPKIRRPSFGCGGFLQPAEQPQDRAGRHEQDKGLPCGAQQRGAIAGAAL